MLKHNPFNKRKEFRTICILCAQNLAQKNNRICKTCSRKANYGNRKEKREVMQNLHRLRISNFIKGKLPPQIRQYDASQEHGDLCPMCRKPHDYYINFNNNAEYVNELFEDNIEIDEVRYSSYYFYMCKACNTIYEELMEDEARKTSRTNQRLFDYIKHHILDVPLAWYERDSLASTMCFFCRNDLGESIARAILVPVDGTEAGAIVYSCEDCYDLAGKNLTFHYNHIDNCKICNTEYPISSGEYEARVLGKDMNKYICPYCYYDIYKNTVKHGERYLVTGCKDCGDSRSIDRCKYNRKVYQEDLNTEKDNSITILCEDCSILRSFTYATTKGSPTTYWMGVHFVGINKFRPDTWYYQVHQCSRPGKIAGSIKVIEQRGYPTPFEASIDGTFKLEEVYNPLKLDD